MAIRARHRFLVVVLWLMAQPSAAQQSSLAIAASTDRAGIDDSFVIEVTLSGVPRGESEPELELAPNFRLIGKSRGHSVSIVQGRTSYEARFQYTVQALREGVFDIGPARSATAAGEIRSGTVRVQVVAGSLSPPPPSAQSPFFEDPWSPFGRADRSRRPERGKVVLLAMVDRDAVYVGEAVTYQLELLTQLRVTNVRPRSEPQFSDVWSEPVEIPNPPQSSRREHNGELYDSYLLKKMTLYPTRSGTVKLEPTVWDVSVLVPDFLIASSENLTRSTSALELAVSPLPEAGRPPSFSGAVGEFDLLARIDRETGIVGDALLFELELKGSGNLQSLSAPELPLLGDFRLYSSTAKPATDDRRGGRSRSWEYVLVARAPGVHTLPPITYSFFDPKRARYRTVTTRPITVTIEKGDDVAATVVAPASGPGTAAVARAVEPIRRDISYLKSHDPMLGNDSLPIYERRYIRLLLWLPLLLIGMASGVAWVKGRGPVDPTLRRRRQALKVALLKLHEAGRAASVDRGSTVPQKISEAISGYVADRFDEPGAGLTRDRMRELLSGSVAEGLYSLLDRVDYLRFAPVVRGSAETQKMIKEAVLRLSALDKSLRSKRNGR